jgi:predicted nucleic acid-binding protein
MAIPSLPLRERRVFVDSSAYLALLDTDDEHHREAIATLQELAQARYRQFTTNVLLIESHALILSVLGRGRAAQFLTDMEESNTVVIRARAADEDRAKQILFQYTDKEFSFADAISFAVMECFAIRLAFSFDRDFAQYGGRGVITGKFTVSSN